MRRAALALALVVGALACGTKSAPLAPEVVQPLPPTGLTGAIVEDGVALSWRRPTKTAGGRRLDDLARFRIDRTPAGSATFTTVGVVIVGDRDRFRQQQRYDWTDHDVSPGSRWSYRVVAETLDDYHSPPAGPLTIDVPAAGSPTPPPVTAPDRPAPGTKRTPGAKRKKPHPAGAAPAPGTSAPAAPGSTAPGTTAPAAGTPGSDTPGAATPPPR